MVRRQHADNLLDEETLAGTGAAREKHVLAGAHGVQNVPGEWFVVMQVKLTCIISGVAHCLNSKQEEKTDLSYFSLIGP